ncbi:MAG TPA: DUF5320 domain-containing protein [Clostridiaceae bacterium]|nr:DUF5320 domain-containing protein [Clostridiaceae bacterium]
MPGSNGTGPIGAGPMTGRGFGFCAGANAARYGTGRGLGLGLGLACRRGFGRWFGRCFTIDGVIPKTQKELLQNQKTILEKRLEAIDKQLENL